MRHTRTRRRHAPAPKPAPRSTVRCPARELACASRRARTAPRATPSARIATSRVRFTPTRRREAFQDVQRAYEHPRADGGATGLDARGGEREAHREVVGRSGGAWSAAQVDLSEGPPSEMDGGAENVASSSGHAGEPRGARRRGPPRRLRSRGRVYDAALAYARLDDYASVHRSRAIAPRAGQWEHSCSDADGDPIRGLWLDRGSFARRRWSSWRGRRDGVLRGVGARGAGGSSHPGGGRKRRAGTMS